MVDGFSKTTHIIACNKMNDTTYIAELYFEGVMRLYGIPDPLFFYLETKFVSHFWVTLW